MDERKTVKNAVGETEESSVNSTMPPSNHKKRGKIWRSIGAVGLAIGVFVAGGLTVWFSLDREIRTLAKIKNVLDEKYYQEIDDDTFYDAIFEAVNKQLDDYSYYMTADEYTVSADALAGNRQGLGLVFLTKTDDGADIMKITRVCGNSPAEQAGIVAGNCVVGFGKTQEEMTKSETFSEFSAFLETCDGGEEFCLLVRTENGEELKRLSKAAYVESYVFYKTKDQSYGFSGENAEVLIQKGAPMSCLNEDTAYIRLVQFGGAAVREFDSVMSLFQAQGKKNLVLDLRGNGGGYMDTLQDIAGYFCKSSSEKKPVVAVADYGDRKTSFKASKNVYKEYFSSDSRICVLADNSTASASEALIGCMLDYGAIGYEDICLAERSGEAKTFGKGIMQATYFLNAKKDALKLTTAEIRWPVGGTSIHGRGILPSDGAKTVKEGATDNAELNDAMGVLFG